MLLISSRKVKPVNPAVAGNIHDPEENINMMNNGQKQIFEEIMHSVDNNSGRLFAIDAPGGTGKTFLLSTLLEKVRSSGKVAVATAYTGIAAISSGCV